MCIHIYIYIYIYTHTYPFSVRRVLFPQPARSMAHHGSGQGRVPIPSYSPSGV